MISSTVIRHSSRCWYTHLARCDPRTSGRWIWPLGSSCTLYRSVIRHSSSRRFPPISTLWSRPSYLRGRPLWRRQVRSCWISSATVARNRRSWGCPCGRALRDGHSTPSSGSARRSGCLPCCVASPGTASNRSNLNANACGFGVRTRMRRENVKKFGSRY